MKKKTIYIIVFVIAIVGNTFISTSVNSDKQNQVSLCMVEAKADENGENDPPIPGDDIVTNSSIGGILSTIIDYLFGEQ